MRSWCRPASPRHLLESVSKPDCHFKQHLYYRVIFVLQRVLGPVARSKTTQTVLLLMAAVSQIIDARPLHAEQDTRPNIILVLTDDQGYGDLGCHGNPEIETPNLDALYKQSIRLTDFHVDPTCSPTRSALMTGRYSTRTGVWHTVLGRSMLHKDEVTLADLFKSSGYQTGIFGKWHLGDNYPFRPQYRGFTEVMIHGGGGVGQTPDYWGNDYFDDTYFRNGKTISTEGYCTDVWFESAIRFIKTNRSRPFFTYLATNAPHGPYLVSSKYSDPYKKMGIGSPRAEFYGMITNIDDNMKRLLDELERLGLSENTILIFMTDNGTAAGVDRKGIGFNAGMRGKKGSEYEGGHRVPCFIRWPARWKGNRDIDALTAHIDILPTLVELCQLKQPSGLDIDGKSLVPLFNGKPDWPKRTLFVHSQRIDHPEKWRKSAVMTERWRLINGKQLFDLQQDPGQQRDLASVHPAVTKQLRTEYEQWFQHISDRFDDYTRIIIGDGKENPTTLTAHDWHLDGLPPWNQRHISQDVSSNGFWAVDVARDGLYEITLRCRPQGVSNTIPEQHARVKIGTAEQSLTIKPNSEQVQFRVQLKKGPTHLQSWLEDENGKSRGAYYAKVRYINPQ